MILIEINERSDDDELSKKEQPKTPQEKTRKLKLWAFQLNFIICFNNHTYF